jgi:hypothetical protein
MPRPDDTDPRLITWTRAFKRWSRQEGRTARAIQYAEIACYFARAPRACRDQKARAVLAYGAMAEEQRRLRIRRAALEHAESQIRPLLSNHEETRQP